MCSRSHERGCVSSDTESAVKSHLVKRTKAMLAVETLPAATALTDASQSVSAFLLRRSVRDGQDSDREHERVYGPVGHCHRSPVSHRGVRKVQAGRADDANGSGADGLFEERLRCFSFGDLDLGASRVGGDVSWTPPESDAGIETYETYLATDAAGSGGALTGSRWRRVLDSAGE